MRSIEMKVSPLVELRHIPGYEGHYAATKCGRIFSFKSNKYLKPHIHKGYERLTLYRDGIGRSFDVHRLVALAWVPNPNNHPMVNHKDGNKRNNRAENLEWVTPRENASHAVSRGLFGGKRRTLTMKEAALIRLLYEEGQSITALARMFGVNRSVIWYIVNYRTYLRPRKAG